MFKQWDSWGKIAKEAGSKDFLKDNHEPDPNTLNILKDSAEKTKKVLEVTKTFSPSSSEDIRDLSSDFCLHSSIQDPDASEEAPPRHSIEVRCFAFF